ncbi:unnamed protein product [Acanthoscelides obtectus]|uniref:Uncharacterized protein n=1 Tax=Acanthoscelides obtectus TaxID=200917 RepID=A0A9P0KPI5_ACAOB|nr:unnamed protein product [Acanthoscelides obtectus]CAK1641912.1 hypothetical protein AOBTE_LOCUS12719 [Acanthoscelides obtectus]
MYYFYVQEGRQPQCSYHTYRRVFKSLNLSFHHPKKDQCSLCSSYKEGSTETKAKLEDSFAAHIAERDSVRKKKKDAKESSQENPAVIASAVFDLQQSRKISDSFSLHSNLNYFDDADTDPDFSCPSDDTSASSDSDKDALENVQPSTSKGKKKLSNPSERIRAKMKTARNTGKEYIDRKNKLHLTKFVKPFIHTCRFKCNDKLLLIQMKK